MYSGDSSSGEHWFHKSVHSDDFSVPASYPMISLHLIQNTVPLFRHHVLVRVVVWVLLISKVEYTYFETGVVGVGAPADFQELQELAGGIDEAKALQKEAADLHISGNWQLFICESINQSIEVQVKSLFHISGNWQHLY